MRKYFFIATLFFSVGAYSQNNNSPYSIIGIGDLETNYYNRTSGMANTGLAYRSDRNLINNNPASYTTLQPQFFAFELSGRGQFVNYSGQPVGVTSASAKDLAIKRLAVGIKVNKWWGSSIGLSSFSTANYAFSSFKNIQGTSTSIPVQYDGSGGVNQVYWGNGFQIGKHLSVGANLSYLFGSLTQTETILTNDLQTSLITTRQTYLRSFYFLYGLQYTIPINKKWDATIAGTYATKKNMDAEYTAVVTDNTGATLTSNTIKNDIFKIPNSTGVGISITKNKKYTFVADYKYQDWASTNYSGVNYIFQNSSRISTGFEISNQKQYFNTSYEKSYIHAGAFYEDSYLNVKGEPLKNMGISMGYGFTGVRTPQLGIYIGLELGQRGTQKNDLVKEQYININFTVSYRDFWRTKGIKYD